MDGSDGVQQEERLLRSKFVKTESSITVIVSSSLCNYARFRIVEVV